MTHPLKSSPSSYTSISKPGRNFYYSTLSSIQEAIKRFLSLNLVRKEREEGLIPSGQVLEEDSTAVLCVFQPDY